MRSFLFFQLSLLAIVQATFYGVYQCPPGYTDYMFATNLNYCYKVYQTFYDRQQAVAQCAQDGATLATISDSSINAMLAYADQVTGSLTFGLSCRDKDDCVFDDGTSFNFTSSFNGFVGGRPNINNGECVALQTMGAQQGNWTSVPCSMFGSFVCHFDRNSSNKVDATVSFRYYRMVALIKQCGVNLTFTDFDTVFGYDVLRIYSGGFSKRTTFISEHSGPLKGFTELIPHEEVLLTFTTRHGTARGFSASINEYDYSE